MSLLFQVLTRCFSGKLKGTATSSFISCFTSAFMSAGIIIYNFLQLHLALSEKGLI